MASYKKDLHAILGLDEKAGPEELRKAYLSLAVKYHPDRNPGDADAEERFKDISQAYAILSDPAARAKYERLHPKKSPQPQQKPRPAAGTGTKPGTAGASSTRGAGQSAGAGTKARPFAARPGAGPKPSAAKTATAKGAGPAKDQKDQAEAFKNAETASAGASQQNPRPEAAETDFDDMLSSFFKSNKGRETLKDLESELKKAGIKFQAEDFAAWVRQKQKPPKEAAPADTRSFLEKLRSWLPGAGARAQKKAAQYDIAYQLTLSPQTAKSGTTVEIAYQKDNIERRLSIKIPPETKSGTKLRLKDQGRQKPDKSHGDLILTVEVSQPLILSDLWK